MSMLSFLYKNGLWISVPLFGLGVLLLWCSILNLVRLGDRSRICNVPLLEQQQVEFAEAGRAVLWVEGPMFTSRFASLSRRPIHRSARWIFTIPHPGRYVLYAKGLGVPQADDNKHQLVFIRPHLPQTVGYVLGTLLGALLTIGSLVLFLLRLTSQGEASSQ